MKNAIFFALVILLIGCASHRPLSPNPPSAPQSGPNPPMNMKASVVMHNDSAPLILPSLGDAARVPAHKATIAWSLPMVPPPYTKIQVWKQPGCTGAWTLRGTVGQVAKVSDTEVVSGATYCYRINALNAVGKASTFTPSVRAVIP